MKRRNFLKTTGTAAAAFVAPTMLPSGRLFAATGSRKANHVVLCLFGGGVRNLESVQKAEGNLMPAMFYGTETISTDMAHAMSSLPASPLLQPLQNCGTLFKQFKYASGPTSHFHTQQAILTGIYSSYESLASRHDQHPDIFELHRKNSPVFSSLDNSFLVSGDTFLKNKSDLVNKDSQNASVAEELIVRHQPELMVVNFEEADICHYDFTQYCDHLRKADHAINRLWSKIQSTDRMKDDTILIVTPGLGRNLNNNSVGDSNGRFGLDHTAPEPHHGGDQMARETFCLIVGPADKVKQNHEINSPSGESIEILPMIANILGFEKGMNAANLKAFAECDIQRAFV